MTNAMNYQWKSVSTKVKRGYFDIKENATIEDGVIKDKAGNDVSHIVELTPKFTDRKVRSVKAVGTMAEHCKENGKFVLALFETKKTHDHRFASLTQQDLARLMFVGTYVAWGSGRLQSGKHIIRKKELQEQLGLSRKRFNEFFKRLITEDIIHEAKETGEIFVNPTVFYRGEMKEHPCDVRGYETTRVFRKTVRELYKQYNGRKLGQLAIVYSVLPFLNFDSNVVCYNPEETDLSLLRPMPVSKLAVLLGYSDPHKLMVALRSVRLDDKPVFTFAHNPRNYKEKRIVINPRVVYAGNGEELKGLTVLFN